MSTEIEKILEECGRNQKELIHILHRVQAEYAHISPQAISRISKHLNISESEIYGVLTFYRAFSLKPRGKHLVTVCTGTACHVRGAPMIVDELKRELNVGVGNTTEDNLFTLEAVNCLGACALGPIVVIDGEYHGQMKISEVDRLLEKFDPEKEKKAKK
ncbi:MAG: NADH-quinone oxidoreductase subunit NuoE [Candidatus Aminicenantaceae bacterium]